MWRHFDVSGRHAQWYNSPMETIKRVCDLESADRAVLERVFGQPLEPSSDAVVILKAAEPSPAPAPVGDDGIPEWFNVLEGMSDEDLAEFDAILKTPVRLAHDS